MAKFVVTKKKQPRQEELTPDDEQSLLSKAGSTALSGLHTIGSMLSWPSRFLHGGLNALYGGKGGVGKNWLNPFDSTGGVEGSRHLINAGLLPENDESKWEWSDLGRGLADFALDPTTYVGGLGVTKAGRLAMKDGTQAAGRIAQIAKGERALLTAGLPFSSTPLVEIGTGQGAAKLAENVGKYSGLTKAHSVVSKSLPVRLARAGFDHTVQGLSHPTLQKHVPESVKNWFGAKKKTASDITRMAQSFKDAGISDADMRMAVEGVSPVASKGWVPNQEFMQEPDLVRIFRGAGEGETPDSTGKWWSVHPQYASKHGGEKAKLLTAEVPRSFLEKNASDVSQDEFTNYFLHNHPPNMREVTDAERMAILGKVSPAASRRPGGALAPIEQDYEAVVNRAFPKKATVAADEPHVFMHINPKKAAEFAGDQLPEVSDDLLERIRSEQVTAPVLHIGNGRTLQTGPKVYKQARAAGKSEYESGLSALQKELQGIPEHIDTPHAQILKKMDEINSGAPLGALVGAKELRAALPHIPKEDFDRAILELSKERLLQGHKHDFAANLGPDDLGNLIDTGRNLHANDGKYWVGVAKPREMPEIPEHLLRAANPAYTEHIEKMLRHQGSRSAIADSAAQRVLDEASSKHMDALDYIAAAAHLNEPGMGVMVPKSQVPDMQRLLGMGGDVGREALQIDHPELANAIALNADNLARQRTLGVGNQFELADEAGVRHFARRASKIGGEDGRPIVTQGSAVLPGKDPSDVGREDFLKGWYEGTEGVNKALSDPEIHDAIAAAGGDAKAVLPLMEQKYGHAVVRRIQDASHKAAIQKAADSIKLNSERLVTAKKKLRSLTKQLQDLRTAAVENMSPAELNAHEIAMKNMAKRVENAQFGKKGVNSIADRVKGATKAHRKAVMAGDDRLLRAAEYMAKHPELKGQRLFGNTPLADLAIAAEHTNKKVSMAPAVYKTIAEHLNDPKGDGAERLGDFLATRGFNEQTAAEQIAGKTFDDPEELAQFLNGRIDSKLAEQLKSLTPNYTVPPAIGEAQKLMGSLMAWWKGGTLAFPSSRARDFIGGIGQNILHGWADPRFIVKDVNQLLSGKTVTRDYSHVPEIIDWLAKSGLQWSPENQTKALRQLIAVHFPQEYGILGDIPTGQVGATLDDLLHNVPKTDKTVFQQMVTEPLKTMAGYGDNEASWLGNAPEGATLAQKAQAAASNPFTGVRGVGETTETTFPPLKASEMVSGASDQWNRTGPFMQMLHGGYKADVAADLVNKAQVLYDPATFTSTERAIKNNLIPFWSFQSRMIPETARQVMDPGSPTSQLVKAMNRAQGTDPSVPDYITQGTAVPLGTREDGSKAYLSAGGQMYEPGVSFLGLAANAMTGNTDAARALGYDTLGMLNPLIGTPLQRTVGQSFFQRGSPISNLDPTTARLMSNIAETAGLRDASEGPMHYPGDKTVDAILGMTPIGRLAAQARTATDPRKDVISKMIDTLTGARVSDVSPGQQLNTLQKRAEDLARKEGAFESRMVGFPQSQLEELEKRDPELARQHRKLQKLMTTLKKRKAEMRKKARG